MRIAITIISSVVAMATLGASPAHSEELRRMACDPDTVNIGVWNRQPLCFNIRKRKLETIRYDFAQFGAEFDLSPIDELAADLGSASKTSIVRDKVDPNFLVLLIANETPVDLKKILMSLNIEDDKNAGERFEKDVRDYQHGIAERTLTFGASNSMLHNRSGRPIYVVVIAQKLPTLFLSSPIIDNMMFALGLSIGTVQDDR